MRIVSFGPPILLPIRSRAHERGTSSARPPSCSRPAGTCEHVHALVRVHAHRWVVLAGHRSCNLCQPTAQWLEPLPSRARGAVRRTSMRSCWRGSSHRRMRRRDGRACGATCAAVRLMYSGRCTAASSATGWCVAHCRPPYSAWWLQCSNGNEPQPGPLQAHVSRNHTLHSRPQTPRNTHTRTTDEVHRCL